MSFFSSISALHLFSVNVMKKIIIDKKIRSGISPRSSSINTKEQMIIKKFEQLIAKAVLL